MYTLMQWYKNLIYSWALNLSNNYLYLYVFAPHPYTVIGKTKETLQYEMCYGTTKRVYGHFIHNYNRKRVLLPLKNTQNKDISQMDKNK